MKTLRELHHEEQIDAAIADMSKELGQLEADHLKRLAKLRRAERIYIWIVLSILPLTLLAFILALVFRK